MALAETTESRDLRRGAIERVAAAVRTAVYRHGPERDLQDAVGRALARDYGEWAIAECQLGPAGRADFAVDVPDPRLGAGPAAVLGRIVVECKVEGAVAAVARQLDRYAARAEVLGVVLATSRSLHARGLPAQLREKPLRVVLFRGLP